MAGLFSSIFNRPFFGSQETKKVTTTPPSPPITDTNFANTDLTLDANRTHDLALKNLTFKNGIATILSSGDFTDVADQAYIEIFPSSLNLRSKSGGIGSAIGVTPTMVELYGKDKITGWINGIQRMNFENGNFFIKDATQGVGGGIGFVANGGVLEIGDIGSNSLQIFGDQLFLTTLKLNLAGIAAQPFANNAAALGGGLVAGDVYYTDVAGEYILKITH